jgi:hypothetical protein
MMFGSLAYMANRGRGIATGALPTTPVCRWVGVLQMNLALWSE